MSHLTRSVLAGGRLFPAGADRSGDAAELIPDGDWWSGPALTPAATAPVEPPRSGRGSGIGAWREYAISIGIEVDGEMTRDDIITLVDGGSP